MRKQNAFIIQFLKKVGHPELIEEWCSNENQEQFQKIRYEYENREKKRCTSFLLFCRDRRPQLWKQFPYYPLTSISKLLGEEWRKHRDSNDEIYEKYKTQDVQQLFYKKHFQELQIKYPHFTPEDILKVVEKMFEKYLTVKQIKT